MLKWLGNPYSEGSCFPQQILSPFPSLCIWNTFENNCLIMKILDLVGGCLGPLCLPLLSSSMAELSDGS